MAVIFDGNDGYQGTNPLSSTPATLACWAKLPGSAAQAFGRLISIEDSANNRDKLSIYYVNQDDAADTLVECYAQHFDNNTAVAQSGAGFVTYNTWQHIAGVYPSDSSRSIWIDGVSRATETTAQTALANIDKISIGYLHWSTGKIQDRS